MRLLAATNNPDKIREFEAILASAEVSLTSPSDRGIYLSVEETGRTFAENARLKAVAFARASNLPAIADDSGLEVDALGGRPGIHSARFGGPHATDRDRILLILRLLAAVPLEGRTARYRAALALAYPGGRIIEAEGTCEGVISFRPVGRHGFGYDPIFYVPSLRRTMAQLPLAIKNRISHRAQAARKLKGLLRDPSETT